MHGETKRSGFSRLEQEVGVFLLGEPLDPLKTVLLEDGVGGFFVEVGFVEEDLRA